MAPRTRTPAAPIPFPPDLQHKVGCPAAEGKLFGRPETPDEFDASPRKAIGIEAYVVTGLGRYDRVTGQYGPVNSAGVVRCIECAAQSVVDAADVPGIQTTIAAMQEKIVASMPREVVSGK